MASGRSSYSAEMIRLLEDEMSELRDRNAWNEQQAVEEAARRSPERQIADPLN
jgi:hypothetical protein